MLSHGSSVLAHARESPSSLPTSLLVTECYSENPSYKRRLSCVPHREEEHEINPFLLEKAFELC